MDTKPKYRGFLDLPAELRLSIYDIIFKAGPYDTAPTRRAELKVYDDHVTIKRICPSPPPRWKGARILMSTCSVVYHEVLAYLYPNLLLDVRICGMAFDPGPMRSRLTSEYPLGKISSCPPLRYIKGIRILLDSWSAAEMARLKVRLNGFLEAVKENSFLDVRYIGFYFDGSSKHSDGLPMSSSDEVALMLSNLRGSRVEVADPNRTVSQEMMSELLLKVNGIDCTHIGWTSNR